MPDPLIAHLPGNLNRLSQGQLTPDLVPVRFFAHFYRGTKTERGPEKKKQRCQFPQKGKNDRIYRILQKIEDTRKTWAPAIRTAVRCSVSRSSVSLSLRDLSSEI